MAHEIETLSPTTPPKEIYTPADQKVFTAELFWLSLSLALVFAYAIQRKYFPWLVVLRDLPWTKHPKDDDSCKEANFVTQFLDSIKRTLFMNEELLIKQVGIDGYMTLRLIRFCIQILAALSVVSLCVLTPLYHYQRRTEKCLTYCDTHNSTSPPDAYRADCVCGFIDLCSMANVPAGSSTLWITSISMLIMTLWILYRLKIEYKNIVRIRHQFWSSRPSKLHTVFVDRIPRALAPPSRLREFFEKLLPGQVHSVQLLSHIEALKHTGETRMKVLMALERAKVQQAKNGGKGPRHWVCCPSPVAKQFTTVDTIETLTNELEFLNAQFKLLKAQHESMNEQADTDENTRPRQAFVTFKNVAPTVIAAQTLVQENMLVKMAPDPSDVRWDSLGERNTAFIHFLRKTVSRVLFLFVLLFWGALTSFISALTSTEALAQQFPGLNDFLLDNPDFVGWLDRLSTLMYVILIATVYPIIALSVKIEVRIAQSNVERAILERYFLFLVVQVFVFYSIAGSVFKSVVDIATNPSHVFSTLSATIPKNASFFIGFIAVKTFWLMFDLIRGYNFIFSLLRLIFYGTTVTKRELRYQACCCCWHFRYPSPMNLSSANANVLLVFFIAVSYAAIQPFVILAALIYFAAANLCFSVILTTSSQQLFDGGGIFWTHTYWCVISSLLTAQMTLVGTLLTKSCYPQALSVLCLCVFTIVMSTHINDKYRTAATDVTLEIAAEIDKFESTPTVEEVPSDRVFLYNVVFTDDDQEPRHEVNIEERSTIKVFRYVHPVLMEKEHVSPDPKPAYASRRGGSVAPATTFGEDVQDSVQSGAYAPLRNDDDEEDDDHA